MDPNANLEEMLKLAQTITERADGDNEIADDKDAIVDQLVDAERLAELVQAMNEWITKGGFLPSAWKRS